MCDCPAGTDHLHQVAPHEGRSVAANPSANGHTGTSGVQLNSDVGSVDVLVSRSPAHNPSEPAAQGARDRIRWRKGEIIGSGASGRVYMGLDEDTVGGQLVNRQHPAYALMHRLRQGGIIAVKEIRFAPDDKEGMDAMQREVELMKSLSHTNIVSYLGTEMDTPNSILYIFTQWVPGGSIQTLIKTFGKLNVNVIRKYTAQVRSDMWHLGSFVRRQNCLCSPVDPRRADVPPLQEHHSP